MSDDPEVVRVYGCRWAWCRLNFADNDTLWNHVVFEHVRRAIPVRRKEILMLRRTEEGLGDSLKISDIMRDPSSSLSQKSKGIVLVAAEHGTQLKNKSLCSSCIVSPTSSFVIAAIPANFKSSAGQYSRRYRSTGQFCTPNFRFFQLSSWVIGHSQYSNFTHLQRPRSPDK